MNIKEQVLSIEQAKHLQELGLDMSEAAHFWCSMKLDTQGHEIKKREWFITLDKLQMHCGFMTFEYIPTYTLQEVLNRLEQHIDDIKLELSTHSIGYRAVTTNRLIKSFRFVHLKNLLKCAYYLLCWGIENEYMEDTK